MIVFRILLSILLFAIMPSETRAADDNKEITDPALTKALIDGFTKMAEVYEKADPKDIEAYQNTMSEHAAFIMYLSRCAKTIIIPEHGSLSMSAVPPSFDIKLKYPITMKTEIPTKPESDTLTVLLVSKETTTSPWKLFDGWIQTKTGEKKEKMALPSAVVQKKANDALPRVLKEKDECKCE